MPEGLSETRGELVWGASPISPTSSLKLKLNKAHRFTEDSSLKIEQAVPKSIPKAVPMQIPKATPKPGEMRNPVAAYSPSNFKEDEVRIAQSGRVFYPA